MPASPENHSESGPPFFDESRTNAKAPQGLVDSINAWHQSLIKSDGDIKLATEDFNRKVQQEKQAGPTILANQAITDVITNNNSLTTMAKANTTKSTKKIIDTEPL